MIKIEKVEVVGWEHAIRGMRNPMNSWDKSDSDYRCVRAKICDACGKYETDSSYCDECENGYLFDGFEVGPNDHELMMCLAETGPIEAKFRRMITVYADITAPLYWWKEFDTYKVGTVANSCSTMHKIHAKEFTLEDFSYEHLLSAANHGDEHKIPFIDVSPYQDKSILWSPLGTLDQTILLLNECRAKFLETKDKAYWWQMIQLLPSSYNQKRTVMLNYEVLANIYQHRRDHKLDEWRELCKCIEELPYSEVITCKTKGENK